MIDVRQVAAMKAMRTRGMADATIAKRHGITRQRVHQLLGPRPRTVRAPPKPAPAPPTRKAFAAALLAWRRRHGLSQAGAARLLGVTTHSVSSWEQQRRGCSLATSILQLMERIP